MFHAKRTTHAAAAAPAVEEEQNDIFRDILNSLI